MATLVDKVATRLAGRIFDLFYDSFRSQNRDTNQGYVASTLDTMKSIFKDSEKGYACNVIAFSKYALTCICLVFFSSRSLPCPYLVVKKNCENECMFRRMYSSSDHDNKWCLV